VGVGVVDRGSSSSRHTLGCKQESQHSFCSHKLIRGIGACVFGWGRHDRHLKDAACIRNMQSVILGCFGGLPPCG